jgi:hypothetical protein
MPAVCSDVYSVGDGVACCSPASCVCVYVCLCVSCSVLLCVSVCLLECVVPAHGLECACITRVNVLSLVRVDSSLLGVRRANTTHQERVRPQLHCGGVGQGGERRSPPELPERTLVSWNIRVLGCGCVSPTLRCDVRSAQQAAARVYLCVCVCLSLMYVRARLLQNEPRYYSMAFALRTLLAASQKTACVLVYGYMGCFDEAVTTALSVRG